MVCIGNSRNRLPHKCKLFFTYGIEIQNKHISSNLIFSYIKITVGYWILHLSFPSMLPRKYAILFYLFFIIKKFQHLIVHFESYYNITHIKYGNS